MDPPKTSAARTPVAALDNDRSAHTQAWRRHRATPLIWDEALARDAAVYATRLARTNRFEHDRQAGKFPRQGESLFRGTRDAYSYAEMIELL